MLVGTEDQAEVREGDRVIEARWFKASRGGEIYQLESDEVYTLQTQSLRAQVSLAQMESRNQRSGYSSAAPTSTYYKLSQGERHIIMQTLLRFENANAYRIP